MIDEKKIEEAANLHRFELIASMHGRCPWHSHAMYQINNGWCKARGGTCIWSEYTPEACLKREEV